MSRALGKVQKQISKKRGAKPNALHENSRDAKRLRRAGAREDKVARILDAASRANQVYVDRVAWFQDALQDAESSVSDEDFRQLTQRFISRYDEELAEAKAQRRPGRPKSKTEEQLQDKIDAEQREYRAGLWVPDMRTLESREKLVRWGGDWSGLNYLHFVRVVRDGVIKPSSFPPKGLS